MKKGNWIYWRKCYESNLPIVYILWTICIRIEYVINNQSFSPDRISKFIASFWAWYNFPFKDSFSSCNDSQVSCFSKISFESMSRSSVILLTISAISAASLTACSNLSLLSLSSLSSYSKSVISSSSSLIFALPWS